MIKELSGKEIGEISAKSREQAARIVKRFKSQIDFVGKMSRVWSTTMGGIEGSNSRRKGGYHFIPLNSQLAIRGILYAKNILKAQGVRVKDMSFLDAGCGFGNVMYYAYICGIKNCYGIDFTPVNTEFGKALIAVFGKELKVPAEQKYRNAKHYYDESKEGFGFMEGNLLDYENYSRHNIIYFYCPLSNQKGQYLFVQRVADLAAKGTIIIGDGQTYTLKDDRRFKVWPNFPLIQKVHMEDNNSKNFKKYRKEKITAYKKAFTRFLNKNKKKQGE